MKDGNTLGKEITRLTLPMAFQQFMPALVGASDAVMLGRLDQNAMSALFFVFPVLLQPCSG